MTAPSLFLVAFAVATAGVFRPSPQGVALVAYLLHSRGEKLARSRAAERPPIELAVAARAGGRPPGALPRSVE